MELITDAYNILVAILIASLLVKRSIMGPQRNFARVACLFISAGIIVLLGDHQQGYTVSWFGALLLMAGMLLTIAMLATETVWNIRTGVAAWKRKQ